MNKITFEERPEGWIFVLETFDEETGEPKGAFVSQVYPDRDKVITAARAVGSPIGALLDLPFKSGNEVPE